MKLTVKLQDGQLKAAATADFEQSILNLKTVHGYGSCLASIAMDALFNAMGDEGSDDADDGPYCGPQKPKTRLPPMPPQPAKN
jgi:hypothetical protein